MAEATKDTPTTPPAAGAGLTEDAVKKLISDGVAAALKPVTDAHAELSKSVGILADTLKNAPPAKAGEAKDDKGGEKKPGAGEALTAEAVQKLIADGIAEANKAQQQTAEQKAARDAFIKSDTSGLAKLPATYQAKLGSDPAKWADEAKGVVATWEGDLKSSGFKIPDVGGGNRDGGAAPAGGAAAAIGAGTGMSEGTAAFAKGLKMPAA